MAIKTYLDAGVFIAAHKSSHPIYETARALLADPNRTFVVSHALRLELFPTARYERREKELEFLKAFFEVAEAECPLDCFSAFEYEDFAAKYGISGAMDAIHLKSALSLGAEEFISTEKSTKPMYRLNGSEAITVTSLHV